MSGNDECVIVHPPTEDDDVWFGFCENLGLWRIKAPPFDAYGVIEATGDMAGFEAALAEAATAVAPARTELAARLEALIHGDRS